MFWKRKLKEEPPRTCEVVKPPETYMKEVVDGITCVHGVPYQYVNWAYEYLDEKPEVCGTTTPYKLRYAYMLYEACWLYIQKEISK
jgi:hypothetical protein